MWLFLTYFDDLTGPTTLTATPSNYKEMYDQMESVVLNFMDLYLDRGFIEHTHSKLKFASLLFYIESEWTRSKKEHIAITIVTEQNYSLTPLRKILVNYAERLEIIPNIFKAFHPGKIRLDFEVLRNLEKIENLCQMCLLECKNVINNLNFGRILMLGLNKAGKNAILTKMTKLDLFSDLRASFGRYILKSVFENSIIDIYDIERQNIGVCFEQSINPDAIVYVVDCFSSVEQIGASRDEFQKIIEHFFGEGCENKLDPRTPVLILGNEFDADGDGVCCDYDLFKEMFRIKESLINSEIFYVSITDDLSLMKSFKWLIMKFMDLCC